MIFSCKTLQTKPSAISVLKENRVRLGFSIATIAKLLGIAPKFVENLEAARYNKLPGTIYIKNFIKKYAELLKLNTDEIIIRYEEERKGGFKKPELKQFVPVCKINSSALLWRRAIVASLALFLVMYLGLEVWGIYKAPALNIETPLEGQVTAEPTLLVKGTTTPEMKLQINGVETVSDGEGKFLETVILNPGNNQIIVTALKKHGRSQTIVRNIIYREKKEEAPLQTN